jgi:endonuclease/exonuclease/phosphatase family metal-dependent hydrolase
MEFHFHPAIGVEEELYGDAVLSAYPLDLCRAGALPGLRGRFVEPRGALLVSVDVSGSELFVLNTHLGLLKGERMRQGESLLGPEWLGALCRGERVIVCGDLNDVRGSAVYQQFEDRFRDAQRLVSPLRPKNTWPSKLPLRRIDHVFLSPGLKVRRVEVPRTELTMVASDHLPVIVEIEL